MRTRMRCPVGTEDVANEIHRRTKSYPKTAGIMLKQYGVKLWLEVYNPITKTWSK